MSKDYSNDTDALARDIAEGIAAVSRTPSVDRGLKGGLVTDVQGGTTAGVGDPSAGNISESLVQNPQPGLPRNTGLGLRTRRQARIETRTRVLPAKVMTSAAAGDDEVHVSILGDSTGKSRDSLTGIEKPADPIAEIQNPVASISGTEGMAKMTGMPIASSGENGPQPIDAGRTVEVVVSEQWEVTTTTTTRFRKNKPSVTRVLKKTSLALVNGFACSGGCTPTVDEFFGFTETSDPADGSDWVYNTGNTYAEGRPYLVCELGTTMPSGSLVVYTSLVPYAYGVIPSGGLVPFGGISYSTNLLTGHFYLPLLTPSGFDSYGYYVIIGCPMDSGNWNFGTIDFADPYGGQSRTWTITGPPV